jgi:hypothetical protein
MRVASLPFDVMGSPGRRKGRRTRSDRPRQSPGPPSLGPGSTYDPPWKSIPEGRGLPRTPIFKAMLPILALAAALVVLVVLVGATVSYLIG